MQKKQVSEKKLIFTCFLSCKGRLKQSQGEARKVAITKKTKNKNTRTVELLRQIAKIKAISESTSALYWSLGYWQELWINVTCCCINSFVVECTVLTSHFRYKNPKHRAPSSGKSYCSRAVRGWVFISNNIDSLQTRKIQKYFYFLV